MGNENKSSVEYFSIILTGLIIGYFLMITNPPKDLLQYNESLKSAVTLTLQGTEITKHLGSISIFLVVYALICLLIGFIEFAMQPFFVEGRWVVTKSSAVPFILALTSTIVLGLVLLPYYGWDLVLIVYFIGVAAFFTGQVLNFPTGARNLMAPLVLAVWIIVFLWIIATIELLNWTISIVAIIIVFILSALTARHLQSKSLTPSKK